MNPSLMLFYLYIPPIISYSELTTSLFIVLWKQIRNNRTWQTENRTSTLRPGQLLVFVPRNFNYGDEWNIVHGLPELINVKYGKCGQFRHSSNLAERRYSETTYGEILKLTVEYNYY